MIWEQQWRTSRHQLYLPALKFVHSKRSNSLLQRELQEDSVLGTSLALPKTRSGREDSYRLKMCKNYIGQGMRGRGGSRRHSGNV